MIGFQDEAGTGVDGSMRKDWVDGESGENDKRVPVAAIVQIDADLALSATRGQPGQRREVRLHEKHIPYKS